MSTVETSPMTFAMDQLNTQEPAGLGDITRPLLEERLRRESEVIIGHHRAYLVKCFGAVAVAELDDLGVEQLFDFINEYRE